MTRLVALCSPVMGSGKSTVAQHLIEKHGYQLVRFADPLKRMVRVMLLHIGISPADCEAMIFGDKKEMPFRYPAMSGRERTFLAFRMLEAMGPVPAEVGQLEFQLVDSLEQWLETYLEGQVTSRFLQQRIGTEWGRDEVHHDLWVMIARDSVLMHHSVGNSVVIDDMRFPNELAMVRNLKGIPLRIVRAGLPVPEQHASEGQLDGEEMPQIMNTSTVEVLCLTVDSTLASE